MNSPPEMYTLPMEKLLDIYLDGLMSGITTSLINTAETPGEEAAESARQFAGYQMWRFTQDPAMMETVRDVIRARINGSEWERHLLKITPPEKN